MKSPAMLRGTSQLTELLSKLPANIERNAVNAALRASARVVVAEARRNAPRKSGKLAMAIDSSSPTRIDGGIKISVRANTKKKHGFLAHMFEYGIARHIITAQDADLRVGRGLGKRRVSIKTANKMLGRGSLTIAGHFVGPVVAHPGVSARPFLRPALDTQQEEVIATFARALRDAVEKRTGFYVSLGAELDE
jgi:HK97 gp10 family phage protein